MIGILDSGLGGLVLTRVLSDFFDRNDIIYFGDTARGPYVKNSPFVIRSFALEGARILVEKGADLIVLACHDISSAALAAIAEKYSVKLIDSVTPSVIQSLKISKFARIGIIGTRATVESGIYENKIRALQPEAKVYSAACPLLLPIVEEGWLKKPETHMILKKYIQPLKIRGIDTLIAASSYYSPLFNIISRKVGKRVKVVDSSVVLANFVIEYLKNNPDLDPKLNRKGFVRFFVSDKNEQIEKIAKRLFRKNLKLEQVGI